MLRPSCPRVRLVLALAGLALAGCGLDDYEQKMQATRANLERIQSENSKLAEPVQIPDELQQSLSSASGSGSVFLRPPKAIETSPAQGQNYRGGTLYPFAPTTNSGALRAMFLSASPTSSTKSFEDFMSAFLSRFPRSREEPIQRTIHVERPDKSKARLEFQSFSESADPKMRCYAFFHTASSIQVAVLFRVYEGNPSNPPAEVMISAKSLGVGAAADELLKRYREDQAKLKQEN